MKTVTLNDPELTSVEASDLGLKTGEWPEFFKVILDGKETIYARTEKVMYRDKLGGFKYLSLSNGMPLMVFND